MSTKFLEGTVSRRGRNGWRYKFPKDIVVINSKESKIVRFCVVDVTFCSRKPDGCNEADIFAEFRAYEGTDDKGEPLLIASKGIFVSGNEPEYIHKPLFAYVEEAVDKIIELFEPEHFAEYRGR